MKPEKLEIESGLMEDALQSIKAGINRKLAAARKMIEFDKEVAAGIYTYAVEEFGKFQLLKEAEKVAEGYRINYKNEFLRHEVKFPKAIKYLQNHNHSECNNIGGSFSKKSFTNSFTLETETSFQSRLGIFYIDLEIDQMAGRAKKIQVVPYVNGTRLMAAIDGLEKVIQAL
jgi:hypothetical protein